MKSALALALVFVVGISTHQEDPPTPKLSIPVRILDVYDGDTLTAEIKLRARVRLLNCWAPELREPGGRQSRANLQRMAAGKDGILVVDLAAADRLDDVLTFGRILAHVWVSGKDLSVEQVGSGHATRSRNGSVVD